MFVSWKLIPVAILSASLFGFSAPALAQCNAVVDCGVTTDFDSCSDGSDGAFNPAADVEIDLRTYCVRVTDFVALQEVGKVLNDTLARGQIAGGVVQGIGWALYEEVVLEDGGMVNSQMTNYIIPASADLPPIRVYFQEQPSPHGPGGAKGLGELPMDGPAPAVINAVCNALGASISSIPLTPERLMEHLEGERG